jgi:hypothetical protein
MLIYHCEKHIELNEMHVYTLHVGDDLMQLSEIM